MYVDMHVRRKAPKRKLGKQMRNSSLGIFAKDRDFDLFTVK